MAEYKGLKIRKARQKVKDGERGREKERGTNERTNANANANDRAVFKYTRESEARGRQRGDAGPRKRENIRRKMKVSLSENTAFCNAKLFKASFFSPCAEYTTK